MFCRREKSLSPVIYYIKLVLQPLQLTMITARLTTIIIEPFPRNSEDKRRDIKMYQMEIIRCSRWVLFKCGQYLRFSHLVYKQFVTVL